MATSEEIRGLSPGRNALTVDVEDYFHVSAFDGVISRDDWDYQEIRVERNVDRILQLLSSANTTGTFFILGWVADRTPDVVRRIHDAGHEIACHGYSHRLVYEMTQEEFREDLYRAKSRLEELCGVQVIGYRAPSYSIVKSSFWAFDVLADLGFRYDSSVFPVVHDRYGVPDSSRFPYYVETAANSRIIEFPLTTVRFLNQNIPVAGGGYLRLLPFWLTRWGLRTVRNKEGMPVIFYVHPWELDPDQPRQKVGWLTRIRHYRNLEKTEQRLSRLLDEIPFSSVREVLGLQEAD